jgi:hypothetical protein
VPLSDASVALYNTSKLAGRAVFMFLCVQLAAVRQGYVVAPGRDQQWDGVWVCGSRQVHWLIRQVERIIR